MSYVRIPEKVYVYGVCYSCPCNKNCVNNQL